MRAIVFCFIALITFVYCKNLESLKSKSSHEPDFKRQPLISPEDDASWDEYKRIKRQNEGDGDAADTVANAVKRFQDFVINSKMDCGAKLGCQQNEIEKPLLFEENPTPKEKCLMTCVLEQTKIMTPDNKISIDTIARLASMISNKNELIVAIARATAENCNRNLNTADKCEAGFQINRCVARGLKTHKIQIVY